MATRGEMEDEVRADLAPHVGDAAAQDPIGLRRAVWRAVDEVAERTDCLHKGRLLSLVADQQRYCPAGLRRHTGLAWKDSSGNWIGDLPVITQHDFDRRSSTWRNEPAADRAGALVVTGPNAFLVWPTPSVARSGGLRVEGYWKPGEIWEYNPSTGADIPAARADECPLPSFAITAAIERAKWYFGKSLLTKNPAIAPVLSLLDQHSTRLIGIVESDTATHWQSLGGAPAGLWRY